MHPIRSSSTAPDAIGVCGRRALGALVLLAGAAAATPARLQAQFQTLQTSDLRLTYTSPMQSYLVPQVVRSFENSLRFHRRLFDYTPDGRINVLMHDLWHYGNAGARPVPENHITVGIEPYGHEYESAPAPERLVSSLNHEMAHIVTVDKATASDRFFRSLFFGKVTPSAEVPLSMLYGYLTTPRWYSPRWYLEGIATYLETWMNGGLGRAIGPYDEMVFRTLVLDSGRRQRADLRRGGTGVGGPDDRLPGWRELVPVRHAVRQLPGPAVR